MPNDLYVLLEQVETQYLYLTSHNTFKNSLENSKYFYFSNTEHFLPDIYCFVHNPCCNILKYIFETGINYWEHVPFPAAIGKRNNVHNQRWLHIRLKLSLWTLNMVPIPDNSKLKLCIYKNLLAVINTYKTKQKLRPQSDFSLLFQGVSNNT